MSSFATDPVLHEVFKRRWEKAAEKLENSAIDPELHGVLRLLNQLPGVATFMSCAGHPDVATKSREAQTTLYITMAVTDESHLPLLALSSELQDEMVRWDAGRPRDFWLSYSMRGWRGEDEEGEVLKGNKTQWWRCACLTYRWGTDYSHNRDKFIALLEATLVRHAALYQQNKEAT